MNQHIELYSVSSPLLQARQSSNMYV